MEYNRNRYEVIAEQEKAYHDFLEKISQIQKDLQSSSKPPFLTPAVDKDLNRAFTKVSEEVEGSIQKYCDYLKEDPIYDNLSQLFQGRITDHFDDEKLKAIYKEGEERFKSKIPPRFEDEKTKESDRKYGDLVLWKEVIELAKELKKDVILVTDERKADWWWKLRDGRNMGARQELVAEIKKEADVAFHMYSSERFLRYGQTFLQEQINQQALEEIQAMKKAEMEEMDRIKSIKDYIEIRELSTIRELELLKKRINEVNNQIQKLSTQSEYIAKGSFKSKYELQDYMDSINFQKTFLDNERAELLQKLSLLEEQLKQADYNGLYNVYIHRLLQDKSDDNNQQ